MASSAAAPSPTDVQQLLNTLLTCPPHALKRWINRHRLHLTLPFLQALKDTYAVTSYILAEPLQAERATRYGLLIAEQLTAEPFALPLAQWARGLWAMFHAPEEAVSLFQQAQPAYRTVGDTLSVARLNANLVGVLAECGRFAEAEAAYQAARPEFLHLIDEQPIYLVWLDQNYGWLLYSQGRYADALAVLDQALDLAQRHNFSTNITGIQVNRHLALGMLGRLAEVEAGFLREREAAQQQQQLMTVARIEMNLGDLYSAQGRLADALRQFQLAQQSFAQLGNELEVGSVMLYQASLFRRMGARRAAMRCYEQALIPFTRCDMPSQIGETLVNYAIIQRQEGEYDQALVLLTQAEAIWQSLNHSLWLAQVHFERIALALEQGAFDHAKSLLQTPLQHQHNTRLAVEFQLLLADTLRLATPAAAALAQAQQSYQQVMAYAITQEDRWLHRHARLGLGKLLLAHEPDQAMPYFEAAAQLDEAMRLTLSIEELKASFHEQANDLFTDLIVWAVQQAAPWRALGYCWRAKASALLDLLQRTAVAQTVQAADDGSLLAQVRQQLATARWEWTQQQASHATPGSESTNSQITQLEQQLLELRRHQNRANVAFASQLAAVDPAAVLATMAADILLEYVRCGDEIYGLYADRQGHCVAQRLGDVTTIADLNARLQLRLGNVMARSARDREKYADIWLKECLPLLAACYQSLVAPLLHHASALKAGQAILIAPCDPLFLLPFAAFWDGQHFWSEQYVLEMIPSGALLLLPPPLAAVHSPPFIIAAASDTITAVRAEATTIAMHLNQSVAFVDRPAIAQLSELRAPPKILHIAAHSLQRADAPLFTALQLSGEVLSVEQCYTLPLQGTALVTLSACTTASGQESESSLLAFQAAFFVAGAQRVLSSLWPVADDATVTWMAHFYQLLAEGYGVPQAVQRVQQRLRQDPAHSHPALWAAFISTRR